MFCNIKHGHGLNTSLVKVQYSYEFVIWASGIRISSLDYFLFFVVFSLILFIIPYTNTLDLPVYYVAKSIFYLPVLFPITRANHRGLSVNHSVNPSSTFSNLKQCSFDYFFQPLSLNNYQII
jgi:hypothetical protein